MHTIYDVLIVGGGHAGAQAALSLRKKNYPGTIAIIGDEPHLPYERPPLSKEYLAGERSVERMHIFPAATWQARGITLLPGRRVVSVDPSSHEVRRHGDDTFGYGTLIWAAGGSPRQMSCGGFDLPGVHSIRTLEDVDSVIAELAAVCHVLVIGGGYIGLESAAALTKRSKRVTVVEAQDRVLARVAGEQLSRFYEAEHRAHAVDIRLGAAVSCIEERNGRAVGARLNSGEIIEAEMVVVGIGISPSIEPLRDAGAACSNGIEVDSHCRTSLPDVFAIGDCALHVSPFSDGKPIRLESVQNANDMAACVAATLCGEERPYHAVPWFWSTQYDLKLQTIGLSAGHDQTVLRGRMKDRSFSIIYLKQGQVIALDCVNAVRDFVQGRALVESRSTATSAELANIHCSLKTVASARA